MWEFKHGNGSFKRGDLVGLRDIKRRASRHALIHRDSFSGPKSTVVSAPGTPDERPGDSIDGRFMAIEQSLYEINSRLARSEDHNAMLGIRLQTAIEGLTRCHQVSPEPLRVASFPLFVIRFVRSPLVFLLFLRFLLLISSPGVVVAHTYIVDN